MNQNPFYIPYSSIVFPPIEDALNSQFMAPSISYRLADDMEFETNNVTSQQTQCIGLPDFNIQCNNLINRPNDFGCCDVCFKRLMARLQGYYRRESVLNRHSK